MAECECLATCIFFNDQMKGLEAVKEMMKNRYCRDDKTTCARYLVFREMGRNRVPSDLIPNQIERAREIISSARSAGGI